MKKKYIVLGIIVLVIIGVICTLLIFNRVLNDFQPVNDIKENNKVSEDIEDNNLGTLIVSYTAKSTEESQMNEI